jgi:hypothetical protein
MKTKLGRPRLPNGLRLISMTPVSLRRPVFPFWRERTVAIALPRVKLFTLNMVPKIGAQPLERPRLICEAKTLNSVSYQSEVLTLITISLIDMSYFAQTPY